MLVVDTINLAMDHQNQTSEIGSVMSGGHTGQMAQGQDDTGPIEDGVLLARVHVPELYVSKCLQFPKDQLVWDVKQQCLASLPKV